MTEGLSRDEDTALRCLAVLKESDLLNEDHDRLMSDLRARDRRNEIRREGTKVPAQRTEPG